MRNVITIYCLILICFANGCSPQHPERRYIVAVDRSGSTDSRRGDEFKAVTQYSGPVAAQKADLEIWSLDSAPHRVYGPKIPVPDEINRIKWEDLATDPQHPLRRTRPAALLKAIADNSSELKKYDVRMLILTDGDNDYADDRRMLKTASAQIATLPKIQLTVVGISPDNKKDWTELVGTNLSTRLKLISATDAQTVADQVTALTK